MIHPPLHAFSHGNTCGHQHIPGLQFVESQCAGHGTKIILSGVMDEINCAMQYIGHFVDASFAAPSDCELSAKEKNIINQAVATIDNWNVLCEQGVSISLQHNPDIQFITQASQELVQTTNVLKSASQKLKSKLSKYNFC